VNVLAAALLAVLASGAPSERLWWIFLNTGPHRDQPAGPEMDKRQAAHLANLDRLTRSGVMPMAGPLGDNGFIRGTAIVRAPSRAALAKAFQPDPFLKIGRLTIEAYRFEGEAPAFGKPSEPFGLFRTTLAIGRKGKSWKASGAASAAAAHAASVLRWKKAGDLALAGALRGEGDKTEVLLFHSDDEKKVQALLATDPAVSSGQIEYELHPQLVPRGVLQRPAR
jgi:uncharacterized protein YciI